MIVLTCFYNRESSGVEVIVVTISKSQNKGKVEG